MVSIAGIRKWIENKGPWVGAAIVFSFLVVPLGFITYLIQSERIDRNRRSALILDCVQGDASKNGPCAPALRKRNAAQGEQLARFGGVVGAVVAPAVAQAVVDALRPEFKKQRDIARSELVVKVVQPDGTATTSSPVEISGGTDTGEGADRGAAGTTENGNNEKNGNSPPAGTGSPEKPVVRQCVLSLNAGSLTVADVVCTNKEG